jgi:branched-chain amino acid transport system permease protein
MTRALTQVTLAAAATAIAALAVPAIADGYWLSVAISAAIFVLPVAGCGLLYGRLGMLALFQVAILGIGAWVALRIRFATGLPFPAIAVISGVVAAVIGVVVSAPALRLSKLHFALLTLMAAGAAEVFFTVKGFPNGGSGFFGVRSALVAPLQMSRPHVAASDRAYFRYVLAAVFLMGLLLWVHLHGRPGRAWAAIRQGTSCAQSLGIGVTQYTLWAVALSCFVTGAGGALFVAQVGTVSSTPFAASASVTIFAVALLGGAYSIPGFVLGGCLAQIIPALIETWGINGTVGLIVFGVGLLVTLLVAPGGSAGALGDAARAFGRPSRANALRAERETLADA